MLISEPGGGYGNISIVRPLPLVPIITTPIRRIYKSEEEAITTNLIYTRLLEKIRRMAIEELEELKIFLEVAKYNELATHVSLAIKARQTAAVDMALSLELADEIAHPIVAEIMQQAPELIQYLIEQPLEMIEPLVEASTEPTFPTQSVKLVAEEPAGEDPMAAAVTSQITISEDDAWFTEPIEYSNKRSHTAMTQSDDPSVAALARFSSPAF